MPRRSYAQIMMDELVKLSKSGKTFIGNGSLQKRLGWADKRYRRVRRELLAKNAIVAGRGKGGSVGLAKDHHPPGVTVFICYSHEDAQLKAALVKHLFPLKQLGIVAEWHDRKIAPGEDWAQKISENLEKADIFLLLVSIDFINSSYCYDVELKRAMERHTDDEAIVIPIILRQCIWNHTAFAALQALPKDAKAVSAWEDRDDALTDVASGVRQVAEGIIAAR